MRQLIQMICSLDTYKRPERKDRVGDCHGGVILYVKDNLYCKRRMDLEIAGVENIWIELAENHKRILFGVFIDHRVLMLPTF